MINVLYDLTTDEIIGGWHPVYEANKQMFVIEGEEDKTKIVTYDGIDNILELEFPSHVYILDTDGETLIPEPARQASYEASIAPPPEPTVEELIATALVTIDENAEKARGKYITAMPGQVAIYNIKEAEAREYVTQGYPSVDPADITMNSTNANGDVIYTATVIGSVGNNIKVEHKDPGIVSSALSITVIGTDISVQLATDASGAITSTATEVKAAIDGDAAAVELVTTTVEGDGTGIVSVSPLTNLSGGTDTFPMLVAEANSLNKTPTEVADGVIIQADTWIKLGAQIEGLRMKYKADVALATTAEEIETIVNEATIKLSEV